LSIISIVLKLNFTHHYQKCCFASQSFCNSTGVTHMWGCGSEWGEAWLGGQPPPTDLHDSKRCVGVHARNLTEWKL